MDPSLIHTSETYGVQVSAPACPVWPGTARAQISR